MGRRLNSNPIDWELIEKEFRLGMRTLRQIAAEFGIQPSAICRKAAKNGWVQDGAVKVRALTEAQLLVAHRKATGKQQNVEGEEKATKKIQKSLEKATPTDDDIAVAATVRTNVILAHRTGIANGRMLVELLFRQLSEVATDRMAIEYEITEETKDDVTGQRSRMLRAVSLPVNASTMRDLAQALRHVVTMERQAFSLDDRPAEEPDTESNLSQKIATQIVSDLNALIPR